MNIGKKIAIAFTIFIFFALFSCSKNNQIRNAAFDSAFIKAEPILIKEANKSLSFLGLPIPLLSKKFYKVIDINSDVNIALTETISVMPDKGSFITSPLIANAIIKKTDWKGEPSLIVPFWNGEYKSNLYTVTNNPIPAYKEIARAAGLICNHLSKNKNDKSIFAIGFNGLSKFPADLKEIVEREFTLTSGNSRVIFLDLSKDLNNILDSNDLKNIAILLCYYSILNEAQIDLFSRQNTILGIDNGDNLIDKSYNFFIRKDNSGIFKTIKKLKFELEKNLPNKPENPLKLADKVIWVNNKNKKNLVDGNVFKIYLKKSKKYFSKIKE